MKTKNKTNIAILKSVWVIGLLFICITLSSCVKKIKEYDSDEGTSFLEEIKGYAKRNEHDYVLIDLRDLENEYTKGHFYGFTSYDLANGSLDEFSKFVLSMYHTEKTIFIIDKDGSLVNSAATALKKAGYKKIRIYLGGYSKLNEYNENETYFRVVIGKDGCNC